MWRMAFFLFWLVAMVRNFVQTRIIMIIIIIITISMVHINDGEKFLGTTKKKEKKRDVMYGGDTPRWFAFVLCTCAPYCWTLASIHNRFEIRVCSFDVAYRCASPNQQRIYMTPNASMTLLFRYVSMRATYIFYSEFEFAQIAPKERNKKHITRIYTFDLW